MDKTVKYPDNLFADVFDARLIVPFDLSDDASVGIEYILLLLKTKSEEMYRAVELRYKQGKTYLEMGEELKVSNEYARQLKLGALRFIRNPKQSNILKNGLVQTVSAQIQQAHEFGYNEGYSNGLAEGIKEGAEKEPGHSSCSRDAIRLDALGLSTRSRNALHHAGKRTAGEIAALSYYDLSGIANLGSKCVQEIACVMASLGYDVSAMQEPTRAAYNARH